jgi:hypothetical protein
MGLTWIGMSSNVACFAVADFLTIGGRGGDVTGGKHCVETSSAAVDLALPFLAAGSGATGGGGFLLGFGFFCQCQRRGAEGAPLRAELASTVVVGLLEKEAREGAVTHPSDLVGCGLTLLIV